jgi:hypothetical protein
MMKKVLLFFYFCLSCSLLQAMEFGVLVDSNGTDGMDVIITFTKGQPCYDDKNPSYDDKNPKHNVQLILYTMAIRREKTHLYYVEVTFYGPSYDVLKTEPLGITFASLWHFFNDNVNHQTGVVVPFNSGDSVGSKVYLKIEDIAKKCGIRFVKAQLFSSTTLPSSALVPPIMSAQPSWIDRIKSGVGRNLQYLLGALGIGAMGYGFYHYYRQR